MRRIVFACQSLTGGNGGIARVDRLIAAVLQEKYNQSRVEVHVFSDARGDATTMDLRVPVRYYGSSRLRFALGLWYSMRSPGYWIYDAAYLARVHPRHGFGSRRPFMIFLHGIEVWEDARPSSIEACRRAHRQTIPFPARSIAMVPSATCVHAGWALKATRNRRPIRHHRSRCHRQC